VISSGYVNNIMILAELEKPRFELMRCLTGRVSMLAAQPTNVDSAASFWLKPSGVFIRCQILIMAHGSKRQALTNLA
jgi:hypothetical protein